MKHSKQFYKDLPKHNGFKWFGFINGKHHFQKHVHGRGWVEIVLLESDLECDKNFKIMCEKELTRIHVFIQR